MSKPKRRERSENWTREERDVLLEIIKNYRHIVDNQNNNANTIKLKNIVWNHIANRFQELSPGNRDVNQLKSFWKRLKMAARKKARLQLTGDTSKCDDESHDEASGSFDNEDSMYGQTEKAEVVLLVDPSTGKPEEMNFDEETDEEHNDSDPNAPEIKSERNTDMEYAIPEIDIPIHRLQPLGNHAKKKSKSVSYKKHTKPNSQESNSEMNLMFKEYNLKRFYTRKYNKNEIKHQSKKHELEIDNLMLERKRIELEIELAHKKLEILDSTSNK